MHLIFFSVFCMREMDLLYLTSGLMFNITCVFLVLFSLKLFSQYIFKDTVDIRIFNVSDQTDLHKTGYIFEI